MKNSKVDQYSIENYPPLMSAEEEKAAVRELELGNPDIRNFLVERTLRIVFFIARKYAGEKADFDDLMSVGSIGLIKASNHFDVSKKIKFATFASQCIRNEMLMYLRRAYRQKEISLEATIGGGETVGRKLRDVLTVGDEKILERLERQEFAQDVREIIKEMPKREQEIVRYRFGLDGREAKTQKQVAHILGLTQSCVSKVEHKIVDKIKKSMEPNVKIYEKK